jgi:hypothetical protein
MSRSLANAFWLALVDAGFVASVWVVVPPLTRERERTATFRWLLAWSIKGLLVPFLLWAALNVGLSYELQPFMPQIQAARNAGRPWFPIYLEVLCKGLFVLSSYWAALTFAWALYQTQLKLEEQPRRKLRALALTCLAGLFIPAGVALLVGGWSVLGLATAIILLPLAAYAPGAMEIVKQSPLYARAIAKIKFGKYTEAELEVIRQLERCEDDFDGWMMLADLYANHFNDLREAEQVVLEVCSQPATTISQLAIALHRLADWQLKTASDPDAARRSLQIICDRCPGTHLAHMAQLRINQLPVSAAELRDQRHVKTIPLPALGDHLDAAPAAPLSALDRRKAAEMASLCVERLKHEPGNVSARERLARLLAERLDNVTQGIQQLNYLLDLPQQPDGQRAEWLGLIAAWQLKYLHDDLAGRHTLERILHQFPNTPAAIAARRRLQLMLTQRREQAAKSAQTEKRIRLVDTDPAP